MKPSVQLRKLLPVLALSGFYATCDSTLVGSAPSIIEITQTGCQFLEPESTDHGFQPQSADDCKRINKETGKARLAAHTPLKLAAGTYTFRIANTDVPYELGFYLRSAQRALIPFRPRISGSGLSQGVTMDYEIELTAGEYIYGCPLNPTPAYTLIVE